MNKKDQASNLQGFEITWAGGQEPEALKHIITENGKDGAKKQKVELDRSNTGIAFSSFPDETEQAYDYETATLLRMKHASEAMSREEKRKKALEQLMSTENPK